MLRKFRFWLSRLFFINCLKKRPVEEIVKECEKYVEDCSSYEPSCNNCARNSLVVKIRGSIGLFRSTYQIWQCQACGNEQEDDGSDVKILDDELEKKGIVFDGDDYRYRFLSIGWWIFIFSLAIFIAGNWYIFH